MIRALIFDSDACFLPAGMPPSPLSAAERLAGLTLLRRAILMAWKAGASEAILVGPDAEACRQWEETEVGLRIPVRVVSAQEPLSDLADTEWLLVLAAQILPRRGFVEQLLETARQEACSVVAVSATTPALGPAILSRSDFRHLRNGSASLENMVQDFIRSVGGQQINTTERDYRWLDSPEALRQADREIYRGLTSITDGYLARVFYRYLSGWFTRRVIDYPVTPNHVTWLHFSLGLAASWLLWQGGYWQGVAGAILLQISVVLDCSDGEIARLKYQFSKFGSWLDVWTDNLVNIAVFAAIAHAAAVRLGPTLSLTLGGLAVVGVFMCILVIFALAKLQSQRGEASRLAVTNRLSSSDQVSARQGPTMVDAIINEATSRDFLVLVVAFSLVGRLEWFVWLAAIGSHVFWIVFGAIQISRLRSAPATRA